MAFHSVILTELLPVKPVPASAQTLGRHTIGRAVHENTVREAARDSPRNSYII
jgi:hypothetical protein